ncbi:MAG TPA: hypothetical protein VN253_04345 [Kofleriaceae bacterium]|nr:hypothetical protein [Kofleriaceae bacterium]
MTWYELSSHINKGYKLGEYLTVFLPRFVARQLDFHARGDWKAAELLGEIISEMLIVRPPDFVRGQFAPLRHLVPQGVAAYLATLDPEGEISPVIFELTNSTCAYEALGFEVPPTVLASFRPYLSRITYQRDHPKLWHWSKGIIALVLDERAVWGPIAGVAPDQPVPFTKGDTFGSNMQAFLAHLAGARLVGASLQDVLPAWRSFLTLAEPMLQIRQIDKPVVLWVARFVFHHIGGAPLSTIADTLHEEIERLVAVGL